MTFYDERMTQRQNARDIYYLMLSEGRALDDATLAAAARFAGIDLEDCRVIVADITEAWASRDAEQLPLDLAA